MSSLAQSQDDGVGTCNGNQSEKVLTPRPINPMISQGWWGCGFLTGTAVRVAASWECSSSRVQILGCPPPAGCATNSYSRGRVRPGAHNSAPKDHDNDAELTLHADAGSAILVAGAIACHMRIPNRPISKLEAAWTCSCTIRQSPRESRHRCLEW